MSAFYDDAEGYEGEPSREVITIQAGGWSQWVGAQTWNLDAARMAHFGGRPSCLYADSGPRVLIYDLRGRRGSLFSSDADPATLAEQLSSWVGVVETHESSRHPSNKYLGHGGDDDDEGDGNSGQEQEESEVWGLEQFGGGQFLSSSFAERARSLLAGQSELEQAREPGPIWTEMSEDGPTGQHDASGVAERGQLPSDAQEPEEEEAVEVEEVEEEVVSDPTVWSDLLEVRLASSSFLEVGLMLCPGLGPFGFDLFTATGAFLGCEARCLCLLWGGGHQWL